MTHVALAAGTRVGPYEIVALVGEGGMGAVYRARDARLHRDVAIKVLLPTIADNPDRLARFAREARVLASLNHPNISQVHGLEESDGVRALVMELVDGPTLADCIARGPMPIDEVLQIAKQIAQALEAAHEHGIVHRDLKPANVKVRPDGMVKVLDFGLAKALDEPGGSGGSGRSGGSGGEEVLNSPTIMSPGNTMHGVILGTAPYMAPEQAKGKPVDRRVDIWAFGCVLFEMLTGGRAFGGETLSEVIAQLLEREPDWRLLPAKTPEPIRRLLHRSLEKDPRRRLDSAAAVRLDIEDALAQPWPDARSGKSADPRVSATRLRRALPWVAAIALAAAGVLAGLFASRDRADVRQTAPRLINAVQVTSSLDVESYPTWSPDGVRLAYQAGQLGWYFVGDHDIWVTQAGSGEPVNLTRGSPANDRMPSWSPDGREIAFFSDRGGEWGVYIVAAIGGNPRKVLSLPGIASSNWSPPRWSQDGTKLFVSVREAEKNVVLDLSLASLEISRVFLPDHDGAVCWDLSVSVDGRRFAYVEGGSGATDITRLWTIAATGEAAVPLTDGRTSVWSPTWSPDGRKIFYVSNRGGSMDLWQQAVTDNGKPVGDPLFLTQGLGIRTAAFSRDGSRLAYTRGGRVANIWRVPLLADRAATWADAEQLTSEHAEIETLDVSPNSTLLAISSDRRGNKDVWLLPTAGGELTQLTTDPTPDWAPRWSPDGKEIAFYAYRSGNRDIWVMPAQGGPARQLTAHPGHDWFPSWSPDGREIAFQSNGRSATLLVEARGGEPRPLVTGGIQSRAEWFSDGRWLLVQKEGRLHRVAREGGELLALPVTPPGAELASGRLSPDNQSFMFGAGFTGPGAGRTFWKLSLKDGELSRVASLDGRRGNTGSIAVDRHHLYFTWREDEADIWVMDVAGDGR